jgi:hypothetical protein
MFSLQSSVTTFLKVILGRYDSFDKQGTKHFGASAATDLDSTGNWSVGITQANQSSEACT